MTSKPPKIVHWLRRCKPALKVFPCLHWCSCDWMSKMGMFKLLGATLSWSYCSVLIIFLFDYFSVCLKVFWWICNVLPRLSYVKESCGSRKIWKWIGVSTFILGFGFDGHWVKWIESVWSFMQTLSDKKGWIWSRYESPMYKRYDYYIMYSQTSIIRTRRDLGK